MTCSLSPLSAATFSKLHGNCCQLSYRHCNNSNAPQSCGHTEASDFGEPGLFSALEPSALKTLEKHSGQLRRKVDTMAPLIRAFWLLLGLAAAFEDAHIKETRFAVGRPPVIQQSALWTNSCHLSSCFRTLISRPSAGILLSMLEVIKRALYSVTERVQVPNISGLWSPKPLRVWFSKPESLSIGYLDSLGRGFCTSKGQRPYVSHTSLSSKSESLRSLRTNHDPPEVLWCVCLISSVTS